MVLPEQKTQLTILPRQYKTIQEHIGRDRDGQNENSLQYHLTLGFMDTAFTNMLNQKLIPNQVIKTLKTVLLTHFLLQNVFC